MITALHLIVAALGLIIYYVKPNWLFLYWMIVLPILKPILCIIAGANDLEEANSLIHGGYFMHLYLIVLLDSLMIRKKRFPLLPRFVAITTVLVLYLFIQAFVTDGGLLYAYYNIKSVLELALPFLILITNDKTRPPYKHLYLLVWCLVFVETGAVILNLAGIRFYVATYQHFLTNYEVMMTGTFLTSQLFGNFMTSLFLYICIDFFCRREMPLFAFLILATLSLFCVLSSGSKMCFVLSCSVLFVFIATFRKKHIVLLIFLILIGYLGISSLLSYNGKEISNNEGINRMVTGLADFTQRKKDGLDDNSTFGLSEKLLESYFWQSPLMGNGLSSKGNDYSYNINSKTNEVSHMKADARLAFVIVDIGLMGLLLYMLFFTEVFRVLRRYLPKQYKKSLPIVFLFYLLFSITESGFWDAFAYPLVYVFYFAFICYEREKLFGINKSRDLITQPI